MEQTKANTDSMMSLGLFVFTINSAPYDQLQRDTKFLWSKKQAVGVGPTYQYLGLDGDSISLSGSLVPPITGGPEGLQKLRDMAGRGKSWNLVSGTGEDMGTWFIEQVSETGTLFKADGTARKIDFSLSLKLAPNLDDLGKLKDSEA